jgi:hypothetical protein
MRRTLRTTLLAAALVLGLLPAGAPAAERAPDGTEERGNDRAHERAKDRGDEQPDDRDDGPADDERADTLDATDNFEFIKNIEFAERPDSPTSSRKATDTDFMDFTVPEGYEAPADVPDGLVPQEGEARRFALVGTYVNGLQVVDITSPEDADVVAVWDCAIAQSDVFVFTQTDEATGETRTFAAYSSDVIGSQTVFTSDCHVDAGVDPGSYGTAIVDITDPYRPQTASFVVTPNSRGTHQLTIHPSGDWLYSSPSARSANRQEGSTGEVHIVDIADPYQPGEVKVVPFLTGFDSHDLTFNADGSRAYAAALSHTVILDTTDPGDPSVVGQIVDPAIYLHHQSDPVTLTDPSGAEREFLIINDELLGAGGNGACPGGGLHIYEITGELEKNPIKVGVFFIPDTSVQRGAGQGLGGTVRCTSHVIQIHPEEEIITIAWFAAGVRVLDISGLASMPAVSAGVDPALGGSIGTGITEIGYLRFDDSDIWAAKVPEIREDGTFEVYGIDTFRGLDIMRFDLGTDAGAEADPGRWMSPEAHAATVTGLTGADLTQTELAAYCTL